MSKLETFLQQARQFEQKNITSKDPDFVAWNNSLIRYLEKNYGINSSTTTNFKNRHYSLSVYTLGTPTSSFISAFKKGMAITVKELETLLIEENEEKNTSDGTVKSYIISDMKEIEDVLNNNVQDLEILKKLHRKVDGKYQTCIKDWSNSMWAWTPNFGFNYELLGVSSLIDNLQTMLYKLSAFAMNLNVLNKEENNMIFQSIINNNNSNVNNLNIQVNFNDIRNKIEKNDSISGNEKADIIDKINELEKVYTSRDSKTMKWSKLKSILIWLSDKGTDVAITLIPVIYQILNQ